MKKRFKSNDIAIDLTSLLDIIFIILLIVMSGQQLLSQDNIESAVKAEELFDQADAAKREADALIKYYGERVDELENTEQYVRFIDVVAYFEEASTLRDRTVIVTAGIDGEGDTVDFPVTPATEAEDYRKLQDYLERIVADAAGGPDTIPVIFSLNRGDESILYRDETAIANIFEYLAEQYDNVFIR